MKRTSFLSFFLVSVTPIFSAISSEPLEKLEKTVPFFVSSTEKHIPLSSNEDIFNKPQKKKIDKEQEKKNIKATISDRINISNSKIHFEKDLKKQEYIEKYKTFHALNDGLSQLECIMDFLADDESLDYTYKNTPFFVTTEEGDFQLLKGENIVFPRGDDMLHTENNHVYRILRHQSFMQASEAWKLLVFFKKNIFPAGTINSFKVENAIALGTNGFLKEAGELILKEMNSYSREKSPLYCEIKGILTDIHDTLNYKIPIICKNSSSTYLKSAQKKINKNENLVSEKFISFADDIDSWIKKRNLLETCFNLILGFSLGQHEHLPTIEDFNKIYEEAQNYAFKFEGEPRRKKIKIFKKFPYKFEAFYNFEVRNLEENLPNNHENNNEDLGNPIQMDQIQEGKQDLEEENDHHIEEAYNNQIEEEKQENIQDVNLEIENNIVESDTIGGKNYWKELTAYHQNQKSQKKRSSSSMESSGNDVVSSPENIYEYVLCNNLKKGTLINDKTTGQDFINICDKLKFNVVANNKGNGSQYYIKPAPDNILFGKGTVYEDAFVSMHLPHKLSDIIPYGYYRYLVNGFRNVFGIDLSN